jgi:hypothetical protein
MRFWDDESGAVQLTGSARLYAHMSRDELLKACVRLAKTPAVPEGRSQGDIVCFPAFAVPGGRLSCVCFLRGDKLHAVEFFVSAIGNRKRAAAERQRAFLFQCLRCTDPLPDDRGGVLFRCPFGTAMVATDPRCGDATLRLTYR